MKMFLSIQYVISIYIVRLQNMELEQAESKALKTFIKLVLDTERLLTGLVKLPLCFFRVTIVQINDPEILKC